MCGKDENEQGFAAVSVPVEDKGESAPPGDAALLSGLVTANHILYRHRIVDASGHVSIGHDKNPKRFLLARNLAPGQVVADDIVEFDLDGAPVNAADARATWSSVGGQVDRAWNLWKSEAETG